MSRAWRRAILLILLVIAAVVPLSAQQALSGRVLRVTDGDTIVVDMGGKEERVRLFGIDSPEDGQAFSGEAGDFTWRQLFVGEPGANPPVGKDVILTQRDKRDRNGRLICDVTLPDGENLNEAIVRAGYAWWYREFAPNAARLAQLEQEAKQEGRGLWGRPNPVEPWKWRNNPVKDPPPVGQPEEIVYRVGEAKRYHRIYCRHHRGEGGKVTLAEARARRWDG